MDEHLWYKDAIIYQLHVKCFFDSTNQGIGDFRGLSEKLEYIRDLGVTAIWLLPFYPSPGKDDGYDISDYWNVHSDFGTLRDIRRFIKQVHRMGMRVITELVVNHTSDQHPWFQAARRAPPGSAKRNYYVWSDTDTKFPETRIIFTDTETSNWTWDPVANAYYWHRFFSHQPDLNLNNPKVVREVIRVMRFWLDMGVDGLRLDAIPYLCVREGTNNENLPETHAVIRHMRRALDQKYADRMLLAEANQWPEDVRAYFGDGDECHMAYHFPMMPRIFIAVAQEDRRPIVDIVEQTPEIPATCQWAFFLRNHDELTLEMVTDKERDYMYQTYAADPVMRRNVGICRRLAPLMNNDRRKIELLHALLLSFPGTPIIYYGDEIGMGDNVFLGDRNGVRTPMQWSNDRNAGFSRADPARLYLPVIMDAVYGYQATNVEAQDRSLFSLLNWMRRIITVRRHHLAFGRGSMRLLQPRNQHVLAYLREYGDERLLCVANLSQRAQPVELDLREFNGLIPMELMGQTAFPRIGELPYLLTLGGHHFYWFRLAADATVRYEDLQALPSPPFWLWRDGWQSICGDPERFKREVLWPFLHRWIWLEVGEPAPEGLHLYTTLVEQANGESCLLCLIDLPQAHAEVARLFLPLSITWDEAGEELLYGDASSVLARVRRGPRLGVLHDATNSSSFHRCWVEKIGGAEAIALGEGELRFQSTSAFPVIDDDLFVAPKPDATAEPIVSTGLGGALTLETFRRLDPAHLPGLEISRFLTEKAHFPNTPALAGSVIYRSSGQVDRPVSLLLAHLPLQSDAWSYTLEFLEQEIAQHHAEVQGEHNDQAWQAWPGEERRGVYLALVHTMGLRIGQMHAALAVETGDPAFDPEPTSAEELHAWGAWVLEDAHRTVDNLQRERVPLSGAVDGLVRELVEARESLFGLIADLLPAKLDAAKLDVRKSRFHGECRLPKLIIAQHDVQITGFTQEQARPGAPSPKKHSPLRDVAGLLRSFERIAQLALWQSAEGRLEELADLEQWLRPWQEEVTGALLAGYREGSQGCSTVPAQPETVERLLLLFGVEKALYEVNQHLGHDDSLARGALRSLLLWLRSGMED